MDQFPSGEVDQNPSGVSKCALRALDSEHCSVFVLDVLDLELDSWLSGIANLDCTFPEGGLLGKPP